MNEIDELQHVPQTLFRRAMRSWMRRFQAGHPPIAITCRGKPVMVAMAYAHWLALQPPPEQERAEQS